MSTQKTSKNCFEKLYKDTYNDVLKFVIFRCNNLNDVNDIVQETYIELYKMMQKQDINDFKPYIIGIAKNKLKKYYTFKSKLMSLFVSKSIDDEDMVSTISSNFNLENHILEKITKDEIWDFLNKKSTQTAKIFYLYYAENVTIREIAEKLTLNQSTVKNYLYRTLKELKHEFGKGTN